MMHTVTLDGEGYFAGKLDVELELVKEEVQFESMLLNVQRTLAHSAVYYN